MYLVNCGTLKLQHFQREDEVEYAILSHRWQHDEPTLQDFQNLTSCQKEGLKKVLAACQLALSNHYEYLWLDTVCIDKTSSSELSEAINSMFRWYQSAQVCYAYLSDVELREYGQAPPMFEFSVWFKRAWTLQELLAPREVIFLDRKWQVFGSRASLYERVANITGIAPGALMGDSLGQFCIAEKMSWASKRSASRVEDIAYSLLGLFGVNMPMLYGEGEKAFSRLQEELLRQSNDQSIFAWRLPPAPAADYAAEASSLLAHHPKAFLHARNIRASSIDFDETSFESTNRGVSIELGLRQVIDGTYEAALQAIETSEAPPDYWLSIYLAKVRGYSETYVRTHYLGQYLWSCPTYDLAQEFFLRRKIFVKGALPSPTLLPAQTYDFKFSPGAQPSLGLDLRTKGQVNWSSTTIVSDQPVHSSVWRRVKLSSKQCTSVCTVDLSDCGMMIQLIHVAFDENLCPMCLVTDVTYLENKYLDLNDKHRVSAAQLDKMPDPDQIRFAAISQYSPNLPWSRRTNAGLEPQNPHFGLWAVIGAARQNLRFTINSRAIKQWPVNQVARFSSNNKRLGKEYILNVDLTARLEGIEYHWDMKLLYNEKSDA